MDVAELVRQLNAYGETDTIEAKEASEVGKSTLETVCSLSNEPGLGGGVILLGIHEDDTGLLPHYEPVGVENPAKVIEDLASQCASVFNIAIRVSVTQHVVANKCIVVVQVEEAAQAANRFSSRTLVCLVVHIVEWAPAM